MVDKSLHSKQKIVQHEPPPIKRGMNGCTRKVKTLSCVLCMVVSNTYCAWFLYFACLRLVSCVRWCPTHIMLCFLFSLSSSCVLCKVVFNTYCAVFFVQFVFVLCKVVSNTYCAWFLYFACLRLVSWLPYVASFSELSISDCPFDIV